MMGIKDLQGKLIAVLGYGVEGKAVTTYLLKHGIKPVLFDHRPWEEWPADEQQKIRDLKINFIFGPDCLKELAGFDVAFRSPGVPLLHPDLQLRIKDKGLRIIITSQTKWFFDHCPAKIIGVTGTKSKGTTCALIYEMLEADLKLKIKDLSQNKSTKILNPKSKIYLTGNIGKIQPLDILDNLKPDDWIVYELSSFQLQDLEKSPHIGVVLMVTSEHLDYHKDVAKYIEAKSAITKYQKADDVSIYNVDYLASVKIGKLGKGKKIEISRKQILSEGCFVKDQKIVIADSNFQLPISSLQLRGAHNLENVCAAAAAAKAAGCNDETIKQTAIGFKGLEHRLEFAAEKDGVRFYNDSFSTTPETAIAAIRSFAEPLILILGGSSKNSDFTELGKTVTATKNIKAIILIGEEAEKIKRTLHPSPYGRGEGVRVLEGAKSMSEIFSQIKSLAQAGDVVLLSPACASFDMFKNYLDRGEQFKRFAIN